MNLHVVVPVLDEAGNVPALLRGVRDRLEPLGLPWRLVVVDDGSTDETAALVRRAAEEGYPAEVVSHPRNLGPGAAFRTGFLHVLETAAPHDLVITMEGDQTSDPRLLPRLLHRVWEEGDDIALASCYLYGGGIRGTNVHRVGLSHVANGLMKKALGLSGLATLSSFYRVYQVQALRRLRERWGDAFITSRGFECMVEILYRAAQLRLRVSEVPMVLDGSRRVGKSKMKVAKTSLAYLRLAWKGLRGTL
ncbi:MAG TPA: glycosyltransferase [Vicinamibacteria bacterium]|nr:glycosyltransferase [Vicinamibacteria bacterium]